MKFWKSVREHKDELLSDPVEILNRRAREGDQKNGKENFSSQEFLKTKGDPEAWDQVNAWGKAFSLTVEGVLVNYCEKIRNIRKERKEEINGLGNLDFIDGVEGISTSIDRVRLRAKYGIYPAWVAAVIGFSEESKSQKKS